MIKSKITKLVLEALEQAYQLKNTSIFSVDIPRQKQFGDFSTNIALVINKVLKKPPLEIANTLKDLLSKSIYFNKVEVAKPGFINFTLSEDILTNNLSTIIKEDANYGKSKPKKIRKYLIEFVSANPTGPLHIGHGRWAVLGDNMSRLLEAIGHTVDREYYVNNVGNQIDKLIASIKAVQENQPIPKDGYGGTYVKELAKQHADHLEQIIDQQKDILNRISVTFTSWFFENTLHDKHEVENIIKKLNELDFTYEKDGATWFKSTEFGDDKDRVLRRADGNTTYFAADIAYHADKFKRNYDEIINIWGTDHHGYVKRVYASMQALKQPIEKLKIIIGQLVTLYRDKEPVRMSKRTGEMVTLEEVIEEIGPDATRFFMAMSDENTHLDFDLELAKNKSDENPVFYVQYAHARICSIEDEVIKSGLNPIKFDQNILKLLTHSAERSLMFKLIMFPDEIYYAATNKSPHKLINYCRELAKLFHSFYHQCRVINDDQSLKQARFALIKSTQIVLKNSLNLLGISAPNRM